ncbi:TonB-dependent receptor plug [Chloroherpeton thalassium ATCC 35110]|uniref:TonB-dependent receptor plug n=2 Tax=Chloroherpeton thalassium TaxID=100716 RepID=B3QSQ9_CHLT3|nr:TonB-dependent receptor plug [Chloroherpeton thalassium ATCC 35110]
MEVRIVTVSKKEEPIFEAPLSSTVLTADEIKNAGATSIMEALRLVPGVIVREETPGNYDIHIRGFDGLDPYALGIQKINTTTLVMVNNRIVYNDAFGGTLWDVLSVGINDVEKIEVVRGPAAALYGPNAVTGVINIITKSPNQKAGWSGSTYSQVGTYSTYLANGAVNYATEDKKFSFRLSSSMEKRDRQEVDYFVLGSESYSATPEYFSDGRTNTLVDEQFPDYELATDNYSMYAHGKYEDEDLELNILGGVSRSKLQRLYFMSSDYTLSTEKNESEFTQLAGEWNGFTFNTDYTNTRNNTLKTFDFTVRTFNVNVDYNIPITESFSIKPGLSFHYVKTISNDSTLLFSDEIITDREELSTRNGMNSSVTNTTTSGFVRGEYFINKLRLIGALRLDKFNTPDKWLLSPQILATYQVDRDLLLRASYGRAARTPFSANLFAKFIPDYKTTFVYLLSGETIPDELLVIDIFEIGGRMKVSDKLSFDVELFYAVGDDFETIEISGGDPSVIINPSSPILFSYATSTMTAKNYGMTLSMMYTPFEKMSCKAYVTLQESKIDDYNVSQNVVWRDIEDASDSSFTSENTPTVFGGFSINYLPAKKWTLNLNSYFYSAQVRTLAGVTAASEDIKANILLNTVASYEIADGIKLFANARNLLGGNRRQYGMSDRIKMTISGGLNATF